MKNVLSILIITMIITSCSKNDKTPIEDKETNLHSINISLSAFKEVMIPIGLSSNKSISGNKQMATNNTENSLGNYVDHIYFFVYSGDEKTLIKSVHQVKGTPGFGVLSESLPVGSYHFVFVASKKDLNPMTTSPLAATHFIDLPAPGGDLFYKAIDVLVDGTLNRSVELERRIALVQFNSEDLLIEKIKKIKITVANGIGSPTIYKLLSILSGEIRNAPQSDPSLAIQGPVEITFTAEDYGKKFSLDYYLMNIKRISDGGSELNFTIETFDINGDIITSKFLRMIKVARGYKTTLTGNIFTGGNEGATVVLPITTFLNFPVVNF